MRPVNELATRLRERSASVAAPVTGGASLRRTFRTSATERLGGDRPASFGGRRRPVIQLVHDYTERRIRRAG